MRRWKLHRWYEAVKFKLLGSARHEPGIHMVSTPAPAQEEPVMSFGRHLREVSDSLKAGSLGEMRAVTRLTPRDLRRGADQAEADAACRRRAAAHMEREGIEFIVPGQVATLAQKDRVA
jgi:hypothetical protein